MGGDTTPMSSLFDDRYLDAVRIHPFDDSEPRRWRIWGTGTFNPRLTEQVAGEFANIRDVYPGSLTADIEEALIQSNTNICSWPVFRFVIFRVFWQDESSPNQMLRSAVVLSFHLQYLTIGSSSE